MKYLKHISILFIAVLALLLLLTPKADAATSGNYTYTVSGGEATITGCTTSVSGAITIPSTLDGYPVTTIGEQAFYDCTGLTSVTIPDSVTTIGYEAFYNCICLESVTIGNSVTTIGWGAFSDCTGLKSVTIPDSVTTIGDQAFYFCPNLTSVTIGNSVTTIGGSAFSYCDGLTSVTIGNSVTTIGGYAFEDCNGLTGVYISDLKAWCEIDFVNDCANPLCFAEKLYLNNQLVTNLVIPNTVTTIGNYAFSSCTGLTSVTIPDSVTTIGGGAFEYCTGLTSVTIPDSVTTIGRSAFYECTGLKTVIYCGTSTQWNSISIGYENSYLTSATRYYHNFSEATCIAPKTCTICGTTEGDPEHNFDNWTQITKPTCTTDGAKSSVCALCGETETVAIPATGHNYSTKVTNPTCTEQGYTTFTCSCGDSYVGKYVQATGHSGSWIDLVPVSCTTDGIRARVCATCNTMVTENIPAFGHSYTSVVTAPTCTTQGYTTKTCSTCGNVEVTNYVSAKGHSWNSWIIIKAATCAAEGTQMRFCNCGTTESQTIEKLPHSYTDGVCTACGAEEPVEVVKFDIDVARMILGNSLEFQFGVAKTKIPVKDGYYALIEKTWADGTTTTKTIPATEWGVAGQYWAIVYDGLAAKEMGDIFYVTIYNAKGQAVSNAKEDSVRAYVERAYASQSATGKTMMVDMLNYGAAAQVHFNYGTDDLANSKLTDAQKAAATATTPEMSNDVVKGNFYQGTRFILQSSIQVQLGFANLTTDMYAVYTYTNAKGENKEVRVEGTDFVAASNGSKIGVELSELVYADARVLVEVTVYNADGTVYGTASDSIESCALRSNAAVFVELMKFADSAKAHLYG